jgi:hypothetical protein
VFWKSKLEKTLSAWLKDGGSLSDKLPRGNDEVKSDAEARLACKVLKQALDVTPIEPYSEASYNLHAAIALFQSVETDDAAARLRAQGLPQLRSLVRRYLQEHHLEASLIVFVAKILAIYGEPDDVSLIVQLARDPQAEDGYLWSTVFHALANHDENAGRAVDGLRSPLPQRFCGIAFLDFCNRLAIAGSKAGHPFNSQEGRTRLKGWLSSVDPDERSYAVSATAALPFLDEGTAAELAAAAATHVDVNVRIEGAWAEAKRGADAGLERLAGYACDPGYASRAIRYLEELGHIDRVPEQAKTPEARALAEMAEWLAHPNELGSPPEEVSVADTRELFWPPTNDRRQLWVIRYKHRDAEGTLRESYGLVGSTTWAMMSEESRVTDPMEIYALHCCWELEMNGDPKAPSERSVAAGRRILAQRNPEFRLGSV